MIIKRYKKNPILRPDRHCAWQSKLIFNASPVVKDNDIYLLYRAQSIPYYRTYAQKEMDLSNIGICKSKDGINFQQNKRFIVPNKEWDKYGCEDPRITKLNNKYYIFYTALSEFPFRASAIKIGLAISKDLKEIKEKHQITPFNAKAMSLFPEKIKDKMWATFSYHTDYPPTKICLAKFNKEKDMWSEEFWEKWYEKIDKYILDLKKKDEDHVEVGAAPIKTRKGWVLLYSYIKDYFKNPLFSVEAALLDLKDPTKIIGRTKGPILVPEEFYETSGEVKNVIFPSGALKKGKEIYLYYGSADTTVSLAFIDEESLLDEILQPKKLENLQFKRIKEKPIIEPSEKDWEKKATFNPGAIYLNKKVHILYRAMSDDNTSVIGYCTSKDGVNIDYRSKKPIYVPREEFENKKQPNANSGCEDPRIIKMGNKLYMFYTAYDSINPPRIALTSIFVDDFLKKKWNWEKPILISPPGTDDKDASFFPEKINGKYYIIHRRGNSMDLSLRKTLKFNKKNYLEETFWVSPRKGWWDSKKIGLSTPPIKTKEGWLIIYHGISDDNTYKVGALLLDIKDPSKVIGRTDSPIFWPEKDYEKEGIVNNVVFPCGAVEIKDELFIYYGGADKVTGVAKIKTKDLLEKLKKCRC